MNHFFRKVPGRGFPGVFRKKCSSGRRLVTSGRTLLPETFRKMFFRKTSPSAFSAIFFGVLSSSPLSSSTLSDAHYKLRVRGRGTNLFAEKKKKALARLAEKKLHGEEKKKQTPTLLINKIDWYLNGFMKTVVRFHLYNPQQAQQCVVRWKHVEEIKFGKSALFYLSEEKKKVRTRVQHVLKALEINYHLCFIPYMKKLNLTLYHSTPLSLIHTPYRLPPPPRRRIIPTRTL
ncbi:hypothetical protein HKD37_08G023476 [Glycine soja]